MLGVLVAHYALVVDTDAEAADIVTPDYEDVRFFGRRIRRAQRSKGNNQAHTNSKTCCYKPIDQTHCLTPPLNSVMAIDAKLMPSRISTISVQKNQLYKHVI
jgi:hypothetical protein